MNPFDALLPDAPDPTNNVRVRLGSIGPGGILLDGDAAPTPASALVQPAGNRVVTISQNRRVYAIGAAGTFDATTSMYIPRGYTGAAWRNRVEAAAHGRSTTIALIGSSSIAGVGASPDVTSGWAHRLRAEFAAAGYPIEGTGIAFLTPAAAATDDRWSMSGIATAWSNHLWRAVPSGAWAQFTADVPGTVVQVHYLNDASDPFTITVNGNPAATITPDGTATAGVWTSTLLPKSSHVVRVTGTGPGDARIVGVECFDPATPGITCTVGGLGGTPSTVWSTNWLAPSSNIRSAVRGGAALALVAANGNDYTLGVSDAAVAARFTSIVQGLRFYGTEPIIVAMPITAGQDPAGYASHVARLYSVADNEGVTLIDMHSRWGSWAQISSAGFSADGVHPSNRGHASYARAVWRALGVG